jgi:hypothetical protein
VVASGDDQDGAMVVFIDVRDSDQQGAEELPPVACPEMRPMIRLKCIYNF